MHFVTECNKFCPHFVCRREVPNEVYKILEAVGGDEKWWEVITNQSWIYHILRAVCVEMIILYGTLAAALFIGIMASLQAVELQKLILAHNEIELLKEDLRNLTSLVVLNLSHNNLTHLPASIGEYDIFYPFNYATI